MTTVLRRALGRFGGATLLDNLPSIDWKVIHSQREANEIDARLRAIEVELDVQARRKLYFNHGNGG